MNRETYINNQLKSMDEALVLGRKALDMAEDIQELYCGPAGQRGEGVSEKTAFSRDTFRYFDANDAQQDMARLKLQLNGFKQRMIDIKIENDKLLLEGGYLAEIDREISGIFLKNTLCKLQAQDEKTVPVIREAVETLQKLRDSIAEQL